MFSWFPSSNDQITGSQCCSVNGGEIENPRRENPYLQNVLAHNTSPNYKADFLFPVTKIYGVSGAKNQFLREDLSNCQQVLQARSELWQNGDIYIMSVTNRDIVH